MPVLVIVVCIEFPIQLPVNNVNILLCRTNINWIDLDDHLRHFNMAVYPVAGDGYCYIRSIIKVLQIDYGRKFSIDEIIELVEENILDNLDYYAKWHPASKREIVRDTSFFLRGRQYTIDVVDVIVAATADALRIQLKVFNKFGSKVNIISHTSPNFANCSVYVRLAYQHYDAVVDFTQVPKGVTVTKNQSVTSYAKDLPSTQEDLNDFNLGKSSKTPKDTQHIDANSLKKKKSCRRSLYTYDEYVSDGGTDDVTITNSQDTADFDMGLHVKIGPKERKNAIHTIVQNAITGRPKPRKNQKNYLNTWKFDNIEAVDVDEVPYKITGNHVLRLSATKEKMMPRARDGRWWRFSDSTRLGFTGTRRFGTCMGSRACPNIECLKVIGDGIVNTSDFTKKSKTEYLCKQCGHYAVQVYCGCFKVLEFHPDNGNLVVFHEGEHICNPKPNVGAQKNYLEKHLDIAIGRTPEETSTNLILYALCTGTVHDAENAADMTINKRLINQFQKNKPTAGQEFLTEPEDKGFARLVKTRDGMKAVDNFRLYRMNSREINGKPSFVFKSSKQAANLMLEMDMDIGNNSVMQREFAYMDGMHTRCNKYRTLTLWTYHPGMRKLQALAIMECETENAENIELFFNTINEMLQEHTSNKNYKFHPCGIIVDEGGANWKAVRAVFGTDSGIRIVGCQWHFLNCARRQMTHVKQDERRSFEVHYRDLIQAHTDKEYERVYNAMLAILKRAGKTNWLEWWDIRKYHIVPCYRGYDMPSLNLAETGHSKLQKMGKHLKLSVASLRDVAMFMKQRAEYTAYLNNERTNIGRGPTQIEIERRQERKDDKLVADFLDVIRDEDFLAEFEEGPDDFMPIEKAKHRYKKDPKNPMQQQGMTGGVPKEKKGRASASKPINNDYPQVPHEIEIDYLDGNPVCVCLLKKSVSVCVGCSKRFFPHHRQTPLDLVFTYMCRRMRPDASGKWFKGKRLSNAYFHARDLACIREEKADITVKELYMTNDMINMLSKEHINRLQTLGYWENIIANRNALI